MKRGIKCLVAVVFAVALSLNALSQVSSDSIQKLIRESIQQGIDGKEIPESFFDLQKILPDDFKGNFKDLFKAINIEVEQAKAMGDIDKLEDGYHRLSTLDSIRGNYKGAYENYKLYNTYRDSLQKKETEKRALQAKMQYEFDKKQAIAKAEQEKKDAEAKRIKNLQYFTIAGLGILLLVILTIAMIQWKNNQQKKKTNIQLQLQNEKVESALADLKSTQAQLIQSEKMASLGELTAGIAHEIQNPLNFVNNFAEVSNELIEELKGEKSKMGNERDDQLENELLNDISLNLQKINHHGKRADAIVKGMLQHSSGRGGVRELTDINALADEYLRLVYHGLRSKDHSVHATVKTDFDNSIGKISIIPQDIGRVLLNLINNAFYAVSEKKKLFDGAYEPTVTISTKQLNDETDGYRIEIRVRDNGNGISQQIIGKIFQPFFTTKPTGQGTGLGLSLSYDIVKAHGGELKVKTTEGEGSEFTIVLSV